MSWLWVGKRVCEVRRPAGLTPQVKWPPRIARAAHCATRSKHPACRPLLDLKGTINVNQGQASGGTDPVCISLPGTRGQALPGRVGGSARTRVSRVSLPLGHRLRWSSFAGVCVLASNSSHRPVPTGCAPLQRHSGPSAPQLAGRTGVWKGRVVSEKAVTEQTHEGCWKPAQLCSFPAA